MRKLSRSRNFRNRGNRWRPTKRTLKSSWQHPRTGLDVSRRSITFAKHTSILQFKNNRTSIPAQKKQWGDAIDQVRAMEKAQNMKGEMAVRKAEVIREQMMEKVQQIVAQYKTEALERKS